MAWNYWNAETADTGQPVHDTKKVGDRCNCVGESFISFNETDV